MGVGAIEGESITHWGRPPRPGGTCSSRAELAYSPPACPGHRGVFCRLNATYH